MWLGWAVAAWALVAVGWAFGWVTARWYQTQLRDLGWDGPDGGVFEVYRCWLCGGVSADPWDVERRYCSVCHRFEDGSGVG